MAGTDSKSCKKTLKSVGTEKSTGGNSGRRNSLICRNLSCQAILSIDDVFCKRCSCLFCHSFDEAKIPTDWLECCSEFGQGKSCGFSCHTKCALERGKVGAVNLGQPIELDGSYYCVMCGKIYGIIGYWKKLLARASVATCVAHLCRRLELSYKLLDGSSKYRELHDIVKEAKFKLETEVGLLSSLAGTRPRGVIKKLSAAREVQKLCSAAITKADKWFAFQNVEGLIPEACCGFLFEEVTSSSVTVALIELPTALASGIQCYKLWYCKANEGTYSEEPDSVITRPERRFSIASLQPCTEYYFRVVSCNETGELGLSVAKCSTRSLDGVGKSVTWAQELGLIGGASDEGPSNCCGDDQLTVPGASQGSPCNSTGLHDLNTLNIPILNVLAWAQKQGSLHEFYGAGPSNYSEDGPVTRPESVLVRSPCISRGLDLNIPLVPDLNEDVPPPRISRGLDLNIASVPDLNEDVPPVDFSRDEQTEHTLVLSDDVNGVARSQGSGESENGVQCMASEEVPAVASSTERGRKRHTRINGEAQDSDSLLVNGLPSGIRNRTGPLDEKFEYFVKTIRQLECEGHIKSEFRLELLTWFGLRSTEQERRVVNNIIRTLIDDPSRLAGQLVEAFSEIISKKKPKGGFCSKPWH